MYIYIRCVVSLVVIHLIACESTSEMPKTLQQKSTSKGPIKTPTSTAIPSIFKSVKKTSKPSHGEGAATDRANARVLSPSHLTKLAKTLALGFEPAFSKDYFEPFERRPRPVTLLAFRKNGLQRKQMIKNNDMKLKSLEVAELQSPFNDVSYFWKDEPGDA